MYKGNEMTLEKLATLMSQGFLESEKKFDNKLEKLATLTQQGFSELKNEIHEVRSDLSEVKSDLNNFKVEMSSHMDHIYGKLYDLDERNTIEHSQYKKHDQKLEDHETRIISLENK